MAEFNPIQCHYLSKHRKLPHLVKRETPFLRSEEELVAPTFVDNSFLGRANGAPPTRFLGVTRMFEERQICQTNGCGHRVVSHATGNFGVEFPVFFFDRDSDTTVNSGIKPSKVSTDQRVPPPKPATIGGKKVLLRTDITEEIVAGQLFAFMYRILFGSMAMDAALSKTNHFRKRSGFVRDTLNAFYFSRKNDAQCLRQDN